MSYFKKTNIFNQIFFSRGTIVVLFFLIMFAGFALYSIVGKSMNAASDRSRAEGQVADLSKKHTDLSKKIELLKTPDGQAQALKEQYPVVSPGEHVVVINDDTSSSATPIDQNQPQQEKSFWDYLKNLVR